MDLYIRDAYMIKKITSISGRKNLRRRAEEALEASAFLGILNFSASWNTLC